MVVAQKLIHGFTKFNNVSIQQVGLAVVNGQLYAVGGFDGTAYLKSIEVYDPEQNQWRLCGSMNYRRLGGGVGVMRAPQTEHTWW
jgi:kelch-like protein 20